MVWSQSGTALGDLMSTFTESRSAAFPDRAIATHLVRERNELRARILQLSAPLDEQSVALDVLADCLIDRLAEALIDATWTPLLSWADAACADRPQAPNIRRMFTSVVPALHETFSYKGFEPLEAALQ